MPGKIFVCKYVCTYIWVSSCHGYVKMDQMCYTWCLPLFSYFSGKRIAFCRPWWKGDYFLLVFISWAEIGCFTNDWLGASYGLSGSWWGKMCRLVRFLPEFEPGNIKRDSQWLENEAEGYIRERLRWLHASSSCEEKEAEFSEKTGWLRKDNRLHLEKNYWDARREALSLQERQSRVSAASVASSSPTWPLSLYSKLSLHWFEFLTTKRASVKPIIHVSRL